ncbi:sensor domain-containing diguanylate cyclase [Sodalinema gerasimenkoae]|uniref:sensor domain-containing diguanylate cyclase n=1 Tax=Sodalinema gerasimenkoae TaxID=2862348 RepID=UPI00135B0DF5|nr:sensor domain-containing diguanylate cyclase [Sodalinema gerasimenkoae]
MAPLVPFDAQDLANLTAHDLSQLIRCFLSFNSNPLENIHRLVNLGRELAGGSCACYQSQPRSDCFDASPIEPLTCIVDGSARSGCSRRQLIEVGDQHPLAPFHSPNCECQQRGDPWAHMSRYRVVTDDIRGKLLMRHDSAAHLSLSQKQILRLVARAIAIEEERLHTQERQQLQQQREIIVARIASQIRESLDLHQILRNTVASLLDFLDADRVIICRIQSDGKGEVLEEARNPDVFSMLGWTLSDPWIVDRQSHQDHLSGQVLVLEDTAQANLEPGVKQLMDFFEVRSRLVMPIVLAKDIERDSLRDDPSSCQPWGLLMVHQCHHPRQWHIDEISVLPQLATQLAIAIQQAQLYQQVQIANRELSELATQDGLTQIANRRRFDAYLDHEWRRLLRSPAPLSLILFDIDFFKQYNDTHGHLAGDRCLQQVAQTLKALMQRATDLVARYGGEEFAIILPETTESGAHFLAEQVRSRIARTPMIDVQARNHKSVNHQITVSVGVASQTPFPEASPQLLIAAADAALYRAKNEGRNRICLATAKDFAQGE